MARSSCLVRHMCTLTHCSPRLLSTLMPGAMNQLEGKRETESQKEFFKVNRGEQVSYFWSDILNSQMAVDPECPMHEWAG